MNENAGLMDPIMVTARPRLGRNLFGRRRTEWGLPPELQRYTYVPSRKEGMGLGNCGLVIFWTRQGW